MQTYTLSEIAHLNTKVLSKENNRKVLGALNLSSESLYTILFSDRLREGDVVALFHSYGGPYGDEIHAFLDALLQESIIAEKPMREPRYTLSQLCWLSAIGMAAGDMEQKVSELGWDDDDCPAVLSTACKEARGNVGTWWSLIKDTSQGSVAHVYIQDVLTSHRPGWPHNKAVTPSMSM